MLHFLPPFIKGPLVFVILAVNTVVAFIPFIILGTIKFFVPIPSLRRGIAQQLEKVAEFWIAVNIRTWRLTQKQRWDVRGVDGLAIDDLSYDDWYLVTSNHRSAADIFVLQQVFNRKIPFLKFFLKQELIWVPLIGFAWWALDLPFMKRYSKEYLEKHPEKRGEDLETTRKACENFRHHPSAVINFLEGTRFSPRRHQQQGDSFDHLLRPKAGGIGYVLSSMGDRIDTLLDVTIAYPENKRATLGFWDFLSGRVTRIRVRVEKIRIPDEIRYGDYANDPAFRRRFQDWVNELWKRKDARMACLMGGGE